MSREDLLLINEILEDLEFEDDAKTKLKNKLALVVEQIKVVEKAQKDAAEIQDKIAVLEGKDENKEK